jgi:hypothetical protein
MSEGNNNNNNNEQPPENWADVVEQEDKEEEDKMLSISEFDPEQLNYLYEGDINITVNGQDNGTHHYKSNTFEELNMLIVYFLVLLIHLIPLSNNVNKSKRKNRAPHIISTCYAINWKKPTLIQHISIPKIMEGPPYSYLLLTLLLNLSIPFTNSNIEYSNIHHHYHHHH